MSTQLIIGPDGRVVTRPRYGGIKDGWSAYAPPVAVAAGPVDVAAPPVDVAADPVETPVAESSAPVEITIAVSDDLGADLWEEE